MSKTNVLFLCTANSARSQMAEALLRKHAGDRYEALSAGLEPTQVQPLAIRVMNEIGIDISGQRSKSVKEYLSRVAVGKVIFVCAKAEKNCPYLYPSLTPESWPFEDPAACQGTEEECLAKFRDVRDQIEERIKAWLAAQS
jgi:arsenate reductase